MIRTLALCLGLLALSPLSSAAEESPFCAELASPGLLSGGGENQPLCHWFGGKAILVVNTASKCGFTPQFKGLQALHERYAEQGLVVLGFPSDDFMGQEYADPEKTAEVCYRNFGVSFPMFGQIDVKGDSAHPLFQRLAQSSRAPGWNFHKYLIRGDSVQDFKSSVKPEDPELVQAIEAALNAR